MECNLISSDCLLVKINPDLFSWDAVLKCFYWFGADFDISYDQDNNNHYVVILQKKDTASVPDMNYIISRVKRDLPDYELRAKVARETMHIRNLLVAKAFAYEEDTEAPVSEIQDPVGFDPLLVK